MKLENLDIHPRLRTPHETADLGIHLVHTHAASIYPPWVIVVLALYALIQCTYPFLSLQWRSLIFWWCLPALEPVITHVLSRKVFREASSTKQLLKNLPSILWRGGGLIFITLFRFSPKRALLQPVFLLEGGRLFRGGGARRRVLCNGEPRFGWIGILFAHAELLASIVISMVIIWLMPEGWLTEIWMNLQFQQHRGALDLETHPLLMELSFGAYLLMVLWMRPYYVSSGFACYLSRRIQLEGWDIELRLRGLVQRLRQNRHIPILALSLCSFLIPTADASALPPLDDVKVAEEERASPEKRMEEIMATKEFSTTKEVQRYFDFGSEEEDRDKFNLDWLNHLDFSISSFIKIVTVLVVGWILIMAVLKFRHHIPKPRDQSSWEKEPPFSISTQRASLFSQKPSKLSLSALFEDLDKGKSREVLSTLYQHMIFQISQHPKIEIQEHLTEGEVWDIVQRFADEGERDFAEDLIQLWLNMAYGHQEPPIESLRQQIHAYVKLFEERGVSIS